MLLTKIAPKQATHSLVNVLPFLDDTFFVSRSLSTVDAILFNNSSCPWPPPPVWAILQKTVDEMYTCNVYELQKEFELYYRKTQTRWRDEGWAKRYDYFQSSDVELCINYVTCVFALVRGSNTIPLISTQYFTGSTILKEGITCKVLIVGITFVVLVHDGLHNDWQD